MKRLQCLQTSPLNGGAASLKSSASFAFLSILRKAKLLPWLLRLWNGVGVDRSRVGEGGHGRVGVGWVRRGGVLPHHMMLRVGGSVGRRGGRGGGREMKVERGGGSGRGGGCRRGQDPLQDHVRVQLGLGAVNPRQGGLQQRLLTPVRERRIVVCIVDSVLVCLLAQDTQYKPGTDFSGAPHC